MWKDMLTEKTGNERFYSQARVYLLFSVLAYFITLGFITVKALKPDMNIPIEPLKAIIDALQWSMALFAGYTFGGKGLDVLKTVLTKGQNVNGAQVPAPEPAPAPEQGV